MSDYKTMNAILALCHPGNPKAKGGELPEVRNTDLRAYVAFDAAHNAIWAIYLQVPAGPNETILLPLMYGQSVDPFNAALACTAAIAKLDARCFRAQVTGRADQDGVTKGATLVVSEYTETTRTQYVTIGTDPPELIFESEGPNDAQGPWDALKAWTAEKFPTPPSPQPE